MEMSGFGPDAKPFIVYAKSSPIFSDRLLIWPHRKEVLCWFEGTALLISGGTLEKNRDSIGEVPFIFKSGLVGAGESIGQQFADRVIKSLIKPEDKIIVYFHWAGDMHPVWANAARAAGNEIIERNRQTGQRYAICFGNGSSLPTDRLYGNAQPGGGSPSLFLWREDENVFADSCRSAALTGLTIPSRSDYCSYTSVAYRESERIFEKLGDYRLLAEFAGPDEVSLSITIRHTDTSQIDYELQSIGKDLEIVLYDAGDLSVPDEKGEVFEDFPGWLGWAPMPKHWKRVA